jgi:hypothetical protein
MNGYRLALGCVIAFCFAGQSLVQSRLGLPSRALAGYGVSLLFFFALAEFATMALRRRLRAGLHPDLDSAPRVRVGAVLAVGSLLLVLNLSAKTLSPYLPLQHRPPPLIPTLAVVGFWLAIIVAACRPSRSTCACLVGLAGLVLGTRILALWVLPYDRQYSDMVPTIDRALDELLAGRFPYRNYPPPMPYLPVMFLAYLPAKLLGVDLRMTNLLLDVASVVVAASLPQNTPGSRGRPTVSIAQVALPLLMLLPTWVKFSVNSHFAPCVLAAVLLGRTVLAGGPKVQAAALALAVGSNQMLAATGPIVFAYWLRRWGWRRAVLLTALATAYVLAIVAPFLLWQPRAFLAMALLDRGALPDGLMAGRLTLLPLLAPLLLHASIVLTALAIGAASFAAWRSSRPEGAVAAMALGLCAALMVQRVSFAHYFLPVLAWAALAPGQPGVRGLPASLRKRHPSRPNTVSPDAVTT